MEEGRLQWHPAFVAALHIEFAAELDVIEIEAEHQLSKKPLQIDVLIIKKAEGKTIRKNIGQIFRRYNVIEYKSPEDVLSIDDFYKVYGYACIYKSDTRRVGEIRPEEITLTFVCNHYPRVMIGNLKRSRGLEAVKKGEGIYYLVGDEFPIQVIITKELSKEENYWLQNLRNDLKAGPEIRSLLENYEENRREPYHQAVMDLIVRANREEMKEERKMCEALKELYIEMFGDELKEAEARALERGMKKGLEKGLERGLEQGIEKGIEEGLERGLMQGLEQGIEKGIEQGLEQGEYRAKSIFKLFAQGVPVELIAERCSVSVEKVKQILE